MQLKKFINKFHETRQVRKPTKPLEIKIHLLAKVLFKKITVCKGLEKNITINLMDWV